MLALTKISSIGICGCGCVCAVVPKPKDVPIVNGISGTPANPIVDAAPEAPAGTGYLRESNPFNPENIRLPLARLILRDNAWYALLPSFVVLSIDSSSANIKSNSSFGEPKYLFANLLS